MKRKTDAHFRILLVCYLLGMVTGLTASKLPSWWWMIPLIVGAFSLEYFRYFYVIQKFKLVVNE